MSGEIDFKASVVKVLRAQGAMCYPMIADAYSPAGWPDLLVVSQFWIGLIEFKGATTRLDPIQAKIIWDLRVRRPGSAWIVREDANGLCEVRSVMRDRTGDAVCYIEKYVKTVPTRDLLTTFVMDGTG
jgi:hypothetical protein